MLKPVLYAALAITGVLGVSICDICKPTAGKSQASAGASLVPTAYAATAAQAQQVEPRAATKAAQTKTVRFKVEGMTCGGCVIGVRTALTRLVGVGKADVSYEKQSAVVTYDPTKVTIDKMMAAIEQLGYKATVGTDRLG